MLLQVQPKYYLTACLMFKDAAPYLDEWLRFHCRVGFDHFYLYDNDSSDDYTAVLRPLQDRGHITLHGWPGASQQERAFQHAIDNYRHEARWMAFLDDDEFLFSPQNANLPEVLPIYELYAGVAAAWLVFGSSGRKSRRPGWVTLNYRRRAALPDKHVKCIVNPAKVIGPAVIGHHFHCVPGETIVDEKFEPLSGPFAAHPSADVLCINHYISKSLEELRWRRSRPTAYGEPMYTCEEYVTADAGFNEIEDTRIQPLIEALKGI